MDSGPTEQRSEPDNNNGSRSFLTTAVTIITWIELVLGLSAISSAVFLNPRVPAFLYAIYGVYFGIFLWFLYSTCRSTYLKQGPMNYLYWICAGCSLATIGVVILTFLMSPNSGEIAFVFMIVFIVSLVLLPLVTAIFYCFLRGNFNMPLKPKYMKGKPPPNVNGVDQPDKVAVSQQTQQYRTEV